MSEWSCSLWFVTPDAGTAGSSHPRRGNTTLDLVNPRRKTALFVWLHADPIANPSHACCDDQHCAAPSPVIADGKSLSVCAASTYPDAVSHVGLCINDFRSEGDHKSPTRPGLPYPALALAAAASSWRVPAGRVTPSPMWAINPNQNSPPRTPRSNNQGKHKT